MTLRAAKVMGFGWRLLRRHPWLPLVSYAASAVPAALLAWLGTVGAAQELDRSLLARSAASQASPWAWVELAVTSQGIEFRWLPTLGWALLCLLVTQVWMAAGSIETLLERERGKAFLAGIERHSARFFRVLVWALGCFSVASLVAIVILLFTWIPLEALARKSWSASFVLIAVLIAGLFIPLHLAFDLVRIAASSHGGRRIFRGLLAAWRHAFRHLPTLLPVYLACSTLAFFAAVVPWLATWKMFPSSGLGLLSAWLLHQLGLVGVATAKCLRWSAAVGYYQAVGEPPWTGTAPPPAR